MHGQRDRLGAGPNGRIAGMPTLAHVLIVGTAADSSIRVGQHGLHWSPSQPDGTASILPNGATYHDSR